MARDVIDRDLGYDDLVATFDEIDGTEPSVFVGIRGGPVTEDGTSLVLVAATNEFGSEDGHVPERSFLRSTVKEQQRKYAGQLAADLGKLVDGKMDMEQVLGRLGEVAKRDVQRKIVALKEPENADRTVAAKGSSNPLVDTGRMRQSIDYLVVT